MFVCARVHLSFVKYILIQTFARTESSLKVGARFCPTHWILRFPRVHTETLQSQWSYAALLGHSGFKQVLDSENKNSGWAPTVCLQSVWQSAAYPMAFMLMTCMDVKSATDAPLI